MDGRSNNDGRQKLLTMMAMTWACMLLAWILLDLMLWDLILYNDKDDKGGGI
jgi:hypothetical protein